MGEGYLADTKLGRKVALEILPADLAANQDRIFRSGSESGGHAQSSEHRAHLSKTRYVSPSALVIAYSGLGDGDRRFAWLETSYESHDEAILFIKDHPMFNVLRDDPRCKAMLNRLNLP